MNTKHLRIYVAACEAGSFSHAAAQLGMSQPALSRIIRELEARQGLQLFTRTGRGVQPTQAGSVFRARALRILGELDLLDEELTQIREHAGGDVNVSIPTRVGRIVMMPLIKRFAGRFPRASIHVFENLNVTTQNLLASGEMDIGIFYLPPRPSSIVFERIGVEDLFVVGQADIVGPDGNPISMAETAELPLILPGEHAHYRKFIGAAFVAGGHTPNVVRELETVHGLLAFAMVGEGVTILPYSSVWEEVEQGLVNARKLVEPPIRRQICIAVRNQATNKLVRDTVVVVKQVVNELPAWVGWNLGSERPAEFPLAGDRDFRVELESTPVRRV